MQPDLLSSLPASARAHHGASIARGLCGGLIVAAVLPSMAWVPRGLSTSISAMGIPVLDVPPLHTLRTRVPGVQTALRCAVDWASPCRHPFSALFKTSSSPALRFHIWA